MANPEHLEILKQGVKAWHQDAVTRPPNMTPAANLSLRLDRGATAVVLRIAVD